MGLNATPKAWAYNAKEEFFLLRAYVSFLESKLRSATQNFDKYLNSDVLELEHELQDGCIHSLLVDFKSIEGTTDLNYDLKALLTKTFPGHERRSSLITIYGIFEYQLIEFCRKLEAYKGISPAFDEVRHKNKPSTIEMAKNWLNRIVGINLSSASPVFEEINTIREIRNWAVHNYGLMDKRKNKKYVIDYIFKHEMLGINGDFFYVMEGFLRHFTDLCHQFFGELEQSVKSL